MSHPENDKIIDYQRDCLEENKQKTAQELDNEKVEKEKELKLAQQNLYQVEQAELELARQMAQLQAQRKDYQVAISKAKHIVKMLNIDIRILESQFWSAKNGGV